MLKKILILVVWFNIAQLMYMGGVGCSSSDGGDSPSIVTQSPSLNLLNKIAITTDGEGYSARPEIITTENRVFVVYLGHIGVGQTFDVKIYDKTLQTVITSKTLTQTTAEYGKPTDIRVVSDGLYLYVFYETADNSLQTRSTHLWGAKYRLDDNFEKMSYTSTPIASSSAFSELADGGELLDDPAPLIGPGGSIFVITRLKYSLSMSGPTIYRVRVFDKDDLNTKLSEFDVDLSSVANGGGRVTSLLFLDNTIYMALATTVSNEQINESDSDSALSDIILVKMRSDWTFDPQTDVRVLSDESNDAENYITGLRNDGSYFYITYKESSGRPPSGNKISCIKIFDMSFQLLHKENVGSGVTWGAGGGEIRPSLELTDNRVLSGQSAGSELGRGNAEIYIYQMENSSNF